MHRLLLIALLATPALAADAPLAPRPTPNAGTPLAEGESLCEPGERVFFHCPAKDSRKWVGYLSLCAAKDAEKSATDGLWLRRGRGRGDVFGGYTPGKEFAGTPRHRLFSLEKTESGAILNIPGLVPTRLIQEGNTGKESAKMPNGNLEEITCTAPVTGEGLASVEPLVTKPARAE